MEDRDFFDLLYQQYTKTTKAETAFWAVREQEDDRLDPYWEVYAAQADGSETHIAAFVEEADADFVAGVHGCLPDLVRRLHEAIDEADRLDKERDDQEAKYAELTIREMELEQQVRSHQETIMHLEDSKSMIQGEWRVERARVEELQQQLESYRQGQPKIEDWHGRAATT